ncbi:ChrR family anti-sigma-E factor [Vibrio sp. MA40-2]|uniref:ChrR family anti-sigma-E factor n=1 Tax=Vibrio sp. MA40-2 TaxID=3391828 RepID=UPI0039A422DF
MINHHPTDAVLKEFVAGNLQPSVAVIVASHVEMCPKCQNLVHQFTEMAAIQEFGATDGFDSETDFDLVADAAETTMLTRLQVDEANQFVNTQADDVSIDMINAITDLPVQREDVLPKTVPQIDVDGTRISLPNAVKSIALKEWQGLGKIARARMNFDDDERRMSLLHIAKGGNVPQHTHKGFEITLLLQGSFSDNMGTYNTGDFMWLDGSHTHNPITSEGCVCLTVSSDAIHFTQGMSKLLNPLGKLIY